MRNYLQLLYHSLSDLGHSVILSPDLIEPSMLNIIFDPLYAVQSRRDLFEKLIRSGISYGFQSVEIFTGNGYGFHHFPFSAEELDVLGRLLENSKFVWTPFKDELECYAKITRKAQYIEYGYHERMNEVRCAEDKLVDVFFFGSPGSPGRGKLLNDLENCGLNVVVQPTGGSLSMRNTLIGAARINLNLSHSFPYRHASPGRLVYLANNGICAVSTPAEDPDGYLNYAAVVPEADLVEGCHAWIAAGKWKREGERALERLRQHAMRDILGAALEAAISQEMMS
jgi:hypothetical protein